jgi:hypothetical protein
LKKPSLISDDYSGSLILANSMDKATADKNNLGDENHHSWSSFELKLSHSKNYNFTSKL